MDALREGDAVEVPKPRGMALTDVGVGFRVSLPTTPFPREFPRATRQSGRRASSK